MDVEKLVEKALKLYQEQDSFAAIMYLCELDDPNITMDALRKAMRHKYWQEKDLVGTLAFARAGTHFGLQSALLYDDSDAELAHELRCGAKGFAYDFASSAWIGWDEPDLLITSADQAAGFDAARVNLRLAVDLERGNLPTSRAHWLMVAYHMAEGEYSESVPHFEKGGAYAHKVREQTDEMLNRGYILIAEMLMSPDDANTSAAFDNLKEDFRALEHGDDFIQQLDTAYEVFSR